MERIHLRKLPRTQFSVQQIRDLGWVQTNKGFKNEMKIYSNFWTN